MSSRHEKIALRMKRTKAVQDYWNVNATVAGQWVSDWYRGKSNKGRFNAQEAIANAGLV